MEQTSPHRLGWTFYRYFAAEMLPPTAIALGVLVLVILTQDLLGYTDLVINRGLGAGAVARIAFYQALPLVAMTLPFALAVGCLSALGRLGLDDELLALETNGTTGFRPVSVSTATMTLFTLPALFYAWRRTLARG